MATNLCRGRHQPRQRCFRAPSVARTTRRCNLSTGRQLANMHPTRAHCPAAVSSRYSGRRRPTSSQATPMAVATYSRAALAAEPLSLRIAGTAVHGTYSASQGTWRRDHNGTTPGWHPGAHPTSTNGLVKRNRLGSVAVIFLAGNRRLHLAPSRLDDWSISGLTGAQDRPLAVPRRPGRGRTACTAPGSPPGRPWGLHPGESRGAPFAGTVSCAGCGECAASTTCLLSR